MFLHYRLLVLSLACLFLAVSPMDSVADKFPYRAKYETVPPIESVELHQKYSTGDAIIIDVRSAIEFAVIHPIDAVHIPVSHVTFSKKVKELIKNNPHKDLVFYCNGITCLKSYEATKKAIENGCTRCFVYDAGIPEWASLYPSSTLLLGKQLLDPKKQIIAKEDFKKKCLSYDEFRTKAQDANVLVIDARDHIQSSGKLPGLKRVIVKPFDKLIPDFIEKKRAQDKTLLIFDQVGKQVRWLEYYLIENGYKDYYFLKGGATFVLQAQKYK